MPHIGNPAEPLGTCLSPSASEYQRRDYVFLNNDAVGLVQAFEVVTDSLYQVHRPLRITFRHPDGPRTIKAPLMARSFSDAAKLEKDPEETRRLIRYHIDRRLVEVEHALRAMLADWDTTGFWLGWSAAVEQGFCDGLRITGDKRRGFGGHGTVGTVELALDHAMPAADSVQAETGLLRLQGPAMRLARYHRQLMSLEEALRASGKPRPGAWPRLLWAKWRPVAVQPDNYGIDFDLVHRVLWDSVEGVALHAAVRAACNALRERCRAAAAEAIAERRRHTAAKFGSGPGAATTCFRALRKPLAASLTFLRCDDGTYTVDPGLVDHIARRAWGEIYRGASGSDASILATFLDRYGHLAFRAPEFQLPPIDPEGFHKFVVLGSPTAGGIDNWTPAEWTYLSRKATRLLAELLTAIEEGAPWPAPTLHCKAAFTAKSDQPDPDDPLDFRVLSVLSILYRRWAGYRNRQLNQWAEAWDDPAIYAGAKGRAGDGAWWLAGARCELAEQRGEDYVIGCIDVFKCHDQVVRLVMFHLLLAAGLPTAIATTYARYHGQLVVHNLVAGGIGEGYHRLRGIPQGCPFSQRFCAVLLRPWVQLARMFHAVPRCLADDLHLYVVGEDVDERFRDALDASHRFVHAIGGRIAPKKNTLCSNCPGLRGRLKREHWPLLDSAIPVCLGFRDLGAHFSSGVKRCAGTGRTRIRGAIAAAHATRRLPTSGDIRVKVLGSKAVAMGHYATEVTPVTDGDARAFRTALTEGLIGPRHAMRAPELTFLAFGCPHLDPPDQPACAAGMYAAADGGWYG